MHNPAFSINTASKEVRFKNNPDESEINRTIQCQSKFHKTKDPRLTYYDEESAMNVNFILCGPIAAIRLEDKFFIEISIIFLK